MKAEILWSRKLACLMSAKFLEILPISVRIWWAGTLKVAKVSTAVTSAAYQLSVSIWRALQSHLPQQTALLTYDSASRQVFLTLQCNNLPFCCGRSVKPSGHFPFIQNNLTELHLRQMSMVPFWRDTVLAHKTPTGSSRRSDSSPDVESRNQCQFVNYSCYHLIV